MKKRVEDRLIHLAFEEEPLIGDTGRIGELAQNAKEEKRLHEYAQLRQDLRSAWEVPEHQLSNERLRHAILGQGLNNAKAEAKADFSWLWSSFATCGVVAALVLVFGRHASIRGPIVSPTPQSVASMPLHFGGQITGSNNVVASNSDADSSVIVDSDPSDGYRMVEVSAPKKVIHTHRIHRKATRVIEAVDPQLQANDGFSNDSSMDTSGGLTTASFPIPASSVGKGQQGNGGAKTVGKPSSSPESVVEIDQDQDDDTGARAAREIASKNVVVGG